MLTHGTHTLQHLTGPTATTIPTSPLTTTAINHLTGIATIRRTGIVTATSHPTGIVIAMNHPTGIVIATNHLTGTVIAMSPHTGTAIKATAHHTGQATLQTRLSCKLSISTNSSQCF